MGLWIKESELEVLNVEASDGTKGRCYLRRISRAAMIKAEERASVNEARLRRQERTKVDSDARRVAAEQQAEHDAKPLDERIEAELQSAYVLHDRKTVLDYGIARIEEGDAADPVITEKIDWLHALDPEVCERIFRELISRNAVLPSRLKA